MQKPLGKPTTTKQKQTFETLRGGAFILEALPVVSRMFAFFVFVLVFPMVFACSELRSLIVLVFCWFSRRFSRVIGFVWFPQWFSKVMGVKILEFHYKNYKLHKPREPSRKQQKNKNQRFSRL